MIINFIFTQKISIIGIILQLLPSRNVSKKMKLKFTKAWIAFLKLPIPLDVYKEVNLEYL